MDPSTDGFGKQLVVDKSREPKQTLHSATRGEGFPADGGMREEKVESVCAGEGSGPAR